MNEKIVLALNLFAQSGLPKILTMFLARYLVWVLVGAFIVWTFFKLPRNLFFSGIARVLIAIGISYLISAAIGFWLDIPRPFITNGSVAPLYEPHSSWKAFPSDHTAGVFVMAASAAFLGFPGLSLVLAGGGLLVGFGRIAAGLHYPLDVLGGMMLGWLVGSLVSIAATWFKK